MEIDVGSYKNRTGQTEVTISAHVRYRLEPGEIRKVLTPKEMAAPPSEKDYCSILDLRAFPLMRDARKRERQTQEMAQSNAIGCQAPGSLEEAIAFHRKEFLDRGWQETRIGNEINDRAEIFFDKQGYLVTVTLGQEKDKDVQISVVNHGNVDLRQLP